MRHHPYLILASTCLISSCLNRPLVYTGSQLGVHAQGVAEGVPDKVTIGYDRSESAWLPRGGQSSVKGGFDAEYRGFSGLAVSDLLVTGEAAGGIPASPADNQSLVVSTTTKFNLGLEAGGSDGAAPSFNAGLKRSILALFPKAAESPDSSGELPSTYTDLSVHASGLTQKIPEPKGVDGKRWLSSQNGVRVVQTVATGEAATRLGRTGQGGKAGKDLNKRIRAGLGLSSPDPATDDSQ